MARTNHVLEEADVNKLFTQVAPHYDRLNDVISLGTQRWWRHRLFQELELQPTDQALDVCCGTGDLAIELARRLPQGRVTGLDFNQAMLDHAFEKTKMIGNLILIKGDAMHLPFDDHQFDVITIGFGLRNVPDADQALAEMYRVLKPGGHLAVLEMSQPTNPVIKLGWQAYFQAFPYLAQLAGGQAADYKYLRKTSQEFVSASELCHMMRQAGFHGVNYQKLNFGAAALHFGVK